MPRPTFETVDDYIGSFPKDVQSALKAIRRAVRAAAPKAEERISYGIPAYKFHGWLVYFSAHKEHCSLHAVTSAFRVFEKDLAKYETTRGAIRFPLDQPMPSRLISAVVRLRVKENKEREKGKK